MPDKCNNTDMPPTIEDYLDALSEPMAVLTGACALLFTLTVLLSVSTSSFIMAHYSGANHRIRSALIVLSFPVSSLCAMTILLFPRSYLLMDTAGAIAVGVGLYNFVTHIPEYFGGFDHMVEALRGQEYQLGKHPPLCCFRCCCKPIVIGRRSLSNMMVLVSQYGVVRPVIGFAAAVLWLDGKYENGETRPDGGYLYIAILGAFTTLCSVVNTRMLVYVTVSAAPHLAHLNSKMKPLFALLILRQLQLRLFNVISAQDVPDCDGILSSRVQGESICQMLLILELFFMTIHNFRVYRRPISWGMAPGEVGPVAAVVFGDASKPHYGTVGGMAYR